MSTSAENLIKTKTISYKTSKHEGYAMNSNAQLKLIAELNLDPIKVKLMHKESGEGWSLAQASAVEVEYRRFLSLMKLFPNEQVAPRFDVDIFWHYHILDTMKYAIDCQHIFGYFLHHFPYIGMSGEDEDDAALRASARMQKLYEASFGEPYIQQPEFPKALVGTTYCANAAQNDSVYYTRPALDIHALSTITAYCAHAAQNDSVNSVGNAVSATAKRTRTTYCANAPQKMSYCANAPQKMTYCANAPRKLTYCANAPRTSACCANAPQSAYCANAPRNDSSYSTRLELAIAA
jgi:hypothetical protein